MYKNIKVEAEHNELILENSHGDKVIIPANKRNWVKQKLSEGCHSCIDSLVETLPVASQYAQDGSWFPSWMNPKNWGVTDYSDKGDFNTAYSTARKEGKDEFLFKDKRYSTKMKPIAGDVVQKREDFTPINNWAATEAAGGKRRQETYGNLGDLYAYFAGQPLKSNTLHYSSYKPTNSKNSNAQYIAIKDDKFIDEVLENYDRVFNRKELLKDEKEINPNTWAVSGYTRPTTNQLNKQRQSGKSGDLFYEKGKEHVSNAIGRYFLSKGKDNRGDYISYYDIFDRGSGKADSKGLLTSPYEIYDRIYIKDYGDGKQKRMYYSDKELSELDVNKKNFDTLALQRELNNRGYKLPKSIKSDGTFDGVWGDETKNALLEYRKSQNKFEKGGSVYPPNTKVKVNQDNQIKEYDISSPEYRDLYNSGKLMSYDKNTDTYSATPLKEVTVTAEAPQWLKYKRDYEKTNPKSNYINQFLTPFAKSLGNTETNYPKRLDDEYEQKSLDYVSEQLIKNKPQGKLSRAEWLNQMSDKEEELIKRNPKYQSSLWADTKRGLTSLVEQNPLQTFQNILNSSDYTNREKQEMLKDYSNHPVMSKLGDAAKILNPLTVPSKMVQSAYKDDYSFTDALKGKKNNAGIVEDIVTDPLNLVGIGLAGKLSKVDKAIDATKAGSKVLNKLDDIVKPIVSSVDNVSKQVTKSAWKMEELPGLHLKSTMGNNPKGLHTQVAKDGSINTENALKFIKNNEGEEKYNLIRQAFGKTLPNKMNYNEFRKIVQDQLIPLEKQFSKQSSNYGISSLGYPSPKFSSFQSAIKNGEEHILKLETQIDSIKNLKSPVNDGNKLLENLTQELKQAKINLDYNKSMLSKLPLENQTLILGNKSKFGRGSSAHGNPEETLGHIHFLRDAETPDVLTVTQIQSDAFQGTHRIMPKNTPNATTLERQQKSLQKMEEIQERNKSVLNKMKTEGVDEAGLPVQDYQIKQFEDIVKAQEQSILFKKADIENFTQKQLLDKNHQERYLQELVDYAGKRGDINKVRVPTSETAAKVQGYKPVTTAEEIIENYNKLKGTPEWDQIMADTPDADKLRLQKVLEGKIKGDIYDLERTTILKKYSEQPKTIKKLFGQEPKIVTDKKGNTWYEFDIPKKFKEGKGEIKALTAIPATIGIGTTIKSQNQNKNEQ